MIFLEGVARPLLLVHTVAAGVLLGSATHHVIGCRHYLRGRFPRVALEKTWAHVAAIAYLVTFAIGLCQYPTYKVRVRAEYFDAPVTVEAELALRREAATQAGSPAPARRERDLGWVARLFDIKEHWAALGAAAALALLVMARRAHPSVEPGYAAAYLGLSAFLCSAAWMSALTGLLTASYRAIGGAT